MAYPIVMSKTYPRDTTNHISSQWWDKYVDSPFVAGQTYSAWWWWQGCTTPPTS